MRGTWAGTLFGQVGESRRGTLLTVWGPAVIHSISGVFGMIAPATDVDARLMLWAGFTRLPDQAVVAGSEPSIGDPFMSRVDGAGLGLGGFGKTWRVRRPGSFVFPVALWMLDGRRYLIVQVEELTGVGAVELVLAVEYEVFEEGTRFGVEPAWGKQMDARYLAHVRR